MELDDIQKLYVKVCAGYERIFINGEECFLKHHTYIDRQALKDKYKEGISIAQSNGIKTEKDYIDFYIEKKWWSQSKEDEIRTIKWLNETPNVKLYAVNLTFEHPRAFILPISQANSMWPHGNKKVWKEIQSIDKNIEVLKTYYLNTHKSRRNLNMLNHPKIETIGQLNYKDFVNKLLISKFVLCPPGNGPDTHRLWETLSARAIPILLNTPFNNLLKKQYPDLPIVIVDDYLRFDYNLLEYNFPNYINLLDKNYWITKIRDEA
jgi:hypothetical protein